MRLNVALWLAAPIETLERELTKANTLLYRVKMNLFNGWQWYKSVFNTHPSHPPVSS